LQDILPDDTNGILVVFENACVNQFTYEINGANVRYLGAGDHHSPKYDHMAIRKKLHELAHNTERKSMYTGAPLHKEYCPFTISVYPSKTVESAHKTKNPVIFTIVAVLIFAFTSLIFYVYDVTVERRQKKVMQSAVHSSAIVSSLFPSAVRDRLYPTQAPAQAKSKLDSFLPETAKGKLQNFLGDGKQSTEAHADTSRFSGSPIAELYPETTVLFGDISGFTAWSSTRNPTQVFMLLETLYAAFDEIAKQRGVFKVETIGDCYVAVVGLPTPRKSHAITMTRFASDCLSKMKELVMVLEKTLGPVRTKPCWSADELKVSPLTHVHRFISGYCRFSAAHWSEFGTNYRRRPSW
jgi:Adenylate and Guanylate cyclase catalytic domain